MSKGLEQIERLEDLYARAWNDAEFAERLKSDPDTALSEYLGCVPENVSIRVVQDTADTRYVCIPSPPTECEVSESDLLDMQGGTSPICFGAAVSVFMTVVISVGATTEDRS